ncbi:MAG: glycosyltransferase family 4 protein [Xanthomonadaceae bacterium]|nr:glycosyltransferase family 4 protein [Xanthomonadaceae bacterium]
MPDDRRPRILLVTRNLPPLVGGMERLNWHMAEELAKHADVRVIGPQGSAVMAPKGVGVDEVPLKPLWKFLLHLSWRAWRVGRAWLPDVVLAGSGLTAPAAWFAARTNGARATAYVHGLDLAVRHSIYRALWWPALRHMDRVIANSRATAELAQAVGVQPDRVHIVPPGVDLPVEPVANDVPRGSTGSAGFRERNQLGHRPLLLSVGRLSNRKGLREFVTRALPQIVAAYPDALLLVVGDAPKDALHARAQTPESIMSAAEQAGVAAHLRFLGTITDYRELGEVYRAADVHVFPVRELAGDPEGFGMVAVEAAAHGLPTVAFATGGVVDAVAEGRSGLLVPPGEYPAFASAVRDALAQREVMRKPCEAFAARFAWPEFGAGVREALFHGG